MISQHKVSTTSTKFCEKVGGNFFLFTYMFEESEASDTAACTLDVIRGRIGDPGLLHHRRTRPDLGGVHPRPTAATQQEQAQQHCPHHPGRSELSTVSSPIAKRANPTAKQPTHMHSAFGTTGVARAVQAPRWCVVK